MLCQEGKLMEDLNIWISHGGERMVYKISWILFVLALNYFCQFDRLNDLLIHLNQAPSGMRVQI